MARDDGYLSARESRRISKENRKITAKLEKTRTRRNVPESEYMTEMKNPANAVEFENLHTFFFTDAGTVKSVDSVSFEVPLGKTVGVVGESGCGKSVTSLSLMQLLQRPQGQVVEGSIRLNTGDKVYEITKTPEHVMQHLRGNFMSMIFQEPMTSLNPVFRIGDQMDEVTTLHKKSEYPTKEAVKGRTIELLKMVGIANSEGIYNMYPHELSGGMRQRVMIAMALACSPKLIIADEPTTALDVTVQKQVIALLNELREKLGFAMIFVSHDLALVAEVAHHITVMYAGQVIEQAPTKELLTHPTHEYTRGLLGAVLSIESGSGRLHQVPGTVPSPRDFPTGDRFAPRSSHPDYGLDIRPVLTSVGPEHVYAALPPRDQDGESAEAAQETNGQEENR